MKSPLQKFNKSLLIFTTLIILSNCAYEFSEDSFIEVSQNPPTASISLNDLSDNQTFYVTTKIIFNYNGNNKHLLYEIKIYIDNVEIKTSSINSGDFNINTESLEDGNHILKVEYIFSSGSGSLADVSGVEAYIKTEEYNFIVDKSPPETIVMKSAEIIDGSIYLSWEPITKLNFDSATLVITNNGSPNYFEITEQEMLKLNYNDTNVHTFIPAGEEQMDHDIEYQIQLKNTRGNTVSNKVNIFIKKFEIEKLILNENQYKLIIPQHTLYSNFDYYLFTDSMSNTHKVSSLGGEIIVDKLIIFPDYNDVGTNLTLYEESGGQNIYKGSLFIPESYNKQFDYDPSSSYGEFLYNQFDNLIYVLRTGSSRTSPDYITIEKLDSETLALVETKFITTKGVNYARDLTITSTGNLIIDVVDISYLVEGNSLSIINQWKLSDFGVQTGSIKYRNNTIVIEQDNQISFYDSTTKELFYNTSKSGYFKMSDDGRYFYINNAFFEINSKVINEIVKTNTNDNVNLVEFIVNQNKCVYNSYDGNPIIFDLMTRTKSTLSDFTRINIMDYDNGTNKLLFVRSEFGLSNTQPSYAYVYDLTSTNFKRIEVKNVVSIWSPNEIPRGYWLQSDKLIYAYGLGFYLDHYINE
ncbi:hypothetical protein [Flavivirga sp. 57AJ16]|uniref:hypothetical protein n=1 Tax=Flavivirga sp. 57AJ16 TaxID=3025307 RepID=UPI002365CC88|nr:hypothetical protein [Flavivirga sp. 57AJ16]MDD7886374.1 hypothetical protein [Flavivirga sp. 57AJ16]